jgi:23S rRNA (adenine2030-N6)-methyltransferase
VTRYRHSFHAGNFADVHKHVTLAALIESLERKDKGFLYLETHAGRGIYDLGRSAESRAAAPAIDRVIAKPAYPPVAAYARAVLDWRKRSANAHAYPGSPLIAASLLRPQDRAVLIELAAEEARALEIALSNLAGIQVVRADGFERLRAHLPPPERRGLTLIDPPYERQDEHARVTEAMAEALARFPTGVVVAWHPIKDARDTAAWHSRLRRRLEGELLAAELWLHPCDSRVALNGSGVVVANPPYELDERMREWLPALHAELDTARAGGTRVRFL